MKVLSLIFAICFVGTVAADNACNITVDPKVVSHTVNPNFLGCHSDRCACVVCTDVICVASSAYFICIPNSGFAHEARGLFAELLNGQVCFVYRHM